jgi:tripartite-type tricarboxylate transporter receptor subunit TctC
MKNSISSFIAAAALSVTAMVPAAAQENYPTKPIRLLVGFAPGGPTDVIARVLARDMTATLGQTVYVENKAGASSMIATREVKNAPPDGYTLLFASLGLNVNPILLGAEAGYNPQTDFAPISNAATLPLLAVTAYDSPIKTMQELVNKAKSKPEAVTFGSSGNGGSGHLAGELLGTMAKAKMLHVPYKGNGPALVEVMAGRVDFMFYPVVGIADSVAAKRVKILAVGTAKRLPQFPDTPTMSEVGFPKFEETAPWVGMLAPAKTQPAVVKRLNAAMLKALAKPEVKAQMEKLGAVVVGDSPSEFSAYLKRDYKRWEEVIKAAGVKAEYGH